MRHESLLGNQRTGSTWRSEQLCRASSFLRIILMVLAVTTIARHVAHAQCNTVKQKREMERTEVLPIIKFHGEGDIRFTQGDTLSLLKSKGWVCASFPTPVDIDRLKVVRFSVRTEAECSVYFELKNKTDAGEKAVVGKKMYNGMWKIKYAFPNTGGTYQTITLALEKHYRSGFDHRLAKVIVFSDPDRDVKIRSIEFAKE